LARKIVTRIEAKTKGMSSGYDSKSNNLRIAAPRDPNHPSQAQLLKDETEDYRLLTVRVKNDSIKKSGNDDNEVKEKPKRNVRYTMYSSLRDDNVEDEVDRLKRELDDLRQQNRLLRESTSSGTISKYSASDKIINKTRSIEDVRREEEAMELFQKTQNNVLALSSSSDAIDSSNLNRSEQLLEQVRVLRQQHASKLGSVEKDYFFNRSVGSVRVTLSDNDDKLPKRIVTSSIPARSLNYSVDLSNNINPVKSIQHEQFNMHGL
jgi:hypothetical protein